MSAIEFFCHSIWKLRKKKSKESHSLINENKANKSLHIWCLYSSSLERFGSFKWNHLNITFPIQLNKCDALVTDYTSFLLSIPILLENLLLSCAIDSSPPRRSRQVYPFLIPLSSDSLLFTFGGGQMQCLLSYIKNTAQGISSSFLSPDFSIF